MGDPELLLVSVGEQVGDVAVLPVVSSIMTTLPESSKGLAKPPCRVSTSASLARTVAGP